MTTYIKPKLPRPFVATAPGVIVEVVPVRWITPQRVRAFVTVNGEKIPGVVVGTWPELIRTYAAIVATWGV